MIQSIETNACMSKIVKHNGVAYLCGQVGAGGAVTEQTKDCWSRVEALLAKAVLRQTVCFRRSSGCQT